MSIKNSGYFFEDKNSGLIYLILICTQVVQT